jgi:hypothetical protein
MTAVRMSIYLYVYLSPDCSRQATRTPRIVRLYITQKKER